MTIAATGSLFVGSLFLLIAAIGVLRLPDLYGRMHAVTKGGTAGIGFMMLALILFEPTISVAARSIGIMLFVALTAPVASHMIGRAAYFSGVGLWKGTIRDELDDREPEHPNEAIASKESSAEQA